MTTIPLEYLTMTVYDEKFENIQPIFTKENTKNTLGEIISKNGLSQLRIAETENILMFPSSFQAEENNHLLQKIE